MSRSLAWTTPANVREQVRRVWDSGRILSAPLSGEALFPLTLRLRRPEGAELAARFDEARQWVREWEGESQGGSGLHVEWSEVRHRQLGANRVPRCVIVPTRESALVLLRKSSEARRFDALANQTLARFPSLREWLVRRPQVLLEREAEWARVLVALDWFLTHPHSGRYMRQVDLPGVDSKFIEKHQGLLMDLQEEVQPSVRERLPVRDFASRFGLRAKPLRVHFRFLDPALYLEGLLSDLTVTVSELAALRPRVERVFITENDVNGLAFPCVPRSLVILGLGYALEPLGALPWLSSTCVYYWGDIDTHGFAILDRLRAHHPRVHSLLMDRDVLLAHTAHWVEEDKPHRGTLSRLTESEAALYEDLRHQRLGERVRLEQEHIGFRWVENTLARLSA
nr:putative cytosolic protein [Myxococcus sp.]